MNEYAKKSILEMARGGFLEVTDLEMTKAIANIMRGAITSMRGIPFDTKAGEFECGMAVWIRENAGDNGEQMERLMRNLRKAREEELTPRQRQMLEMRFEQNMKISEISEALGVNRSTVSRTIIRAKKHLRKCLKYSF